MKKYIVCIVVALIACVAQVNAVEFKNTYQGTVRTSSGIRYQATAPTVSFQSTSLYSDQWEAGTSMLNDDGSVNTEAYGVGRSNASGPRRVGGQSGTPGQSGTQQPIGDGLWVLMVLAVGYAGVRRARSTRFAK